MMPRAGRFLLLLASAITVQASAAAAAPRTHVVIIDKMKFGPMPADLRAGDRVVWENRDMFRHTATARDGRFDIDLPPGAKAAITMSSSGAIAIYCRFHPGMRAVMRAGRR